LNLKLHRLIKVKCSKAPNRVGIRNSTDYSPFGVELDGRTVSLDGYRYGFQNQEKDDEIKGEGNSINYTFRMHDPRLGRFFAVDPLFKKNIHSSTYLFANNRVVDGYEWHGLIWKDGAGKEISNEKLSEVKVYIFHDNDFAEQAMVQYQLAVNKYGEGKVAMSNTGTTNGFAADWANMQGIPTNVLIMTHGKNQSIKIGEKEQFTSTGTGRTNIRNDKAPNIQDLPEPKAIIINCTLYMYSCHSNDTQPKPHGEGDHRQGELKGVKGKKALPIAQVFASEFRFKSVIGTAGSVNYHSFFTDFTSPLSKNYLMPYPENHKWDQISILNFSGSFPAPKNSVKY